MEGIAEDEEPVVAIIGDDYMYTLGTLSLCSIGGC